MRTGSYNLLATISKGSLSLLKLYNFISSLSKCPSVKQKGNFDQKKQSIQMRQEIKKLEQHRHILAT